MKPRTMWVMETTRVFWLLVCVRCASPSVPAPANVSVRCTNFQTVVSWSYSPQLLDTRFRVSIASMPPSQTTTEDLQYDLSDLVWASLMSSRVVYVVNVSAVRGDQESARSTSPTFTFNRLQDRVQIFCTLDLPPVELLVNSPVARISFQNPMKLHHELRWAARIQKSDPLILTYDVTEDNMTKRGECGALEQTCTLEWSLLHRKEEHCVSMSARLSNSIHFMDFKPLHLCGRPAETYMLFLFLGLLLGGFVLAGGVVLYRVWKTNACVQRSPPLPAVLDPAFWSNRQKKILDLESEAMDPLRVSDKGPSASREDTQVEGMEDPQGEGMEDPQVEGMEDPQVEGMEDPQVEGMEDPQVEGMEDPQVERMEDPQVEGMEDPQVERMEDPLVEGMEDPQGECGEVEEEPRGNYEARMKVDMGSGDQVWTYGL